CKHCGHLERASATAVNEERTCRECGTKGRVVAVQVQESAPSEEDVDLGDLADDLIEEIDADMAAVVPKASVPSLSKGLPNVLLERNVERVSFFQGNPALNLLSGLSTGVVSFFFCIAIAILVFPTGWESGYFSYALNAVLISAIVGGILTALRSYIYFGVSALDPAGGAVLGIIVAGVVAAMPEAEPSSIAATALTCAMGMAIITGFMAWFTLACKSGNWIRFMPIQILGGVLAGLGVTLLGAAYRFLTGSQLSLATIMKGLKDFGLVLESGSNWAWLPAFLFGWLLFVFFRKLRNPVWLALALVATGALCNGLRMAGMPVPQELIDGCGRLVYDFDVGRFSTLYSLQFLDSIDWAVIDRFKVELAAGVVLTLTMALYKITRVESSVGREMSLENELMILGSNNVLAGLAGGVPLSFCLGRSLGNRRGGAMGPLAALISSLALVAAMLFSAPIFVYVPSFIPAGLLVFFGINLINRWLFAARAEFFRADDYMLLVLTFAVTVTFGYPLGVGTGLALAMMVSVTRYGSGGVVKQILSGTSHRSHVDRASTQLKVLKEKGDSIMVIRLQGFVTVGALYGVLQEIHRRMAAPDRVPLTTMIFDFSAVRRFGSAMSQGFARLHALALDNDINLILTHVPFEIEERLASAGYVDADRQGGFKLFQNLDYAMEWSEDRVLEAAGVLSIKESTLPELLEPVYPKGGYIPQLMKILEPITIKTGQYVFKQGDPSDAMYFIQSGMFRVELVVDGAKTLRLKKMGPGTVFGEMGLYTDAPRSASVVAAEGGTVYRLSKKRIALIETKLPSLKSSIDRYLVTLLAGRVADANAMVMDLMR
ncbi:MAG: cyclic nucleotide-binding domain-containing protein, partial [Proteobacteria bacterium]|nr:cyclic nucleotide-binding domain-containing protein [Pseudomonadota bacterium]